MFVFSGLLGELCKALGGTGENVTSLAACKSCHLPVRGLAKKKNKKGGILVIPTGVTAGLGGLSSSPLLCFSATQQPRDAFLPGPQGMGWVYTALTAAACRGANIPQTTKITGAGFSKPAKYRKPDKPRRIVLQQGRAARGCLGCVPRGVPAPSDSAPHGAEGLGRPRCSGTAAKLRPRVLPS